MKNLNTNDYGLIELGQEEKRQITGGSIFALFAVIAGLIAATAALIDYIQNN